MSDKTKGYTPEVSVVRIGAADPCKWWVGDNDVRKDLERAYLVRGLPMPGEMVRHEDGTVDEVVGLCPFVRLVARSDRRAEYLTPYDPQAEKVERVAKALYSEEKYEAPWEVAAAAPRYRSLARAAIKAMEES